MRTFILILLITLAPLRGIAGELMASHMATPVATGLTTVVASLWDAGDAHHSAHHCDEALDAGNAASQPAQPTEAASHDGCKNCGLCQMCATAALPADLHIALPVLGSQTQASRRSDHFVSASAALAQKPPIS